MYFKILKIDKKKKTSLEIESEIPRPILVVKDLMVGSRTQGIVVFELGCAPEKRYN